MLIASLFDITASAQDRIIFYQTNINRESGSAVFRKKVNKGISHHFRLRAKKGQTLTVFLQTGKKTSFTIYAPTTGIIEGADGTTIWRGTLHESGEYIIAIGTDITANYKLEISLK